MTHAPLAKPLRSQLENTVKSARDVAETAARAALQQLAVGEGRVPDYLNDAQRVLRRRLRAHGRSLGNAKHGDDTQELRRLPGHYLAWFAREGFPKGQLGELLALMHELDHNDLRALVEPLRKRPG